MSVICTVSSSGNVSASWTPMFAIEKVAFSHAETQNPQKRDPTGEQIQFAVGQQNSLKKEREVTCFGYMFAK